MSDVLFISHAQIDKELAASLKKSFKTCFPGVDVFVSSDPEDLSPGDPWVATVLDNLARARLLLALCSTRGLSRKWVWFESGAAWMNQLRLIPCAIGEQRKNNLPPPFSSYQGLNIDDVAEFEVLLEQIATDYGTKREPLDVETVITDLIREDVRAEERMKVLASSTLSRNRAQNV